MIFQSFHHTEVMEVFSHKMNFDVIKPNFERMSLSSKYVTYDNGIRDFVSGDNAYRRTTFQVAK